MFRRLFPALAMVALVMAAGLAIAQTNEWKGTETLVLGDYFAISIENPDGDVLLIAYDIKVDSGPAIDIFVLDDEGYEDYTSQDPDGFKYYRDLSRLDTKEAKVVFPWSDDDTVHIVIDNTAAETVPPLGDPVATVSYKVNADESGAVWVYWWLPFFIFGLSMVLIVILLVFVNRANAKKEEAAAAKAEPPAEEAPPAEEPPSEPGT
ncbi:MAG: hypothetical protein KAQ96_02320 [Thermoplasmata archaeon]|nr:hypothetical protein [Thermoplasmata archaeon]